MLLLTEEEVADLFRVKVSTIQTWTRQGKFPQEVFFKLPNSRRGIKRFIKTKLEEWIENNGCLQT